VAKGPAGADIGRGAAGGYINLVSKSAQLEDFSNGTASITTGNSKRVTADLNRQLGATTALRLNVLAQDGGVIDRNVTENQSLGFAPSLVLGLGTPTRITLSSQHIRQDNTPDGGIPSVGLQGFYNANAAIAKAPRVDRENFYGLSSDYEKVDADMATVKIEHDLAGGAKLTNMSRYGKSKMDRILTGINAITAVTADPATWTIARTRQSVLQDNEILANQTNLVATFNAAGVEHTVSTGIEFMTEKQNSPTRVGLGTVANANLYKPNPNDVVTALNPVKNGVYTKGSTTTAAAYLFDTIKLNEQWQLNGGLRAEHYTTDTQAAALSTAVTHPALPVGTLVPSNLENSDNLVSWKAGVLYKPAASGSIYASLANSKTPPGSANFSLSSAAGNVNGPSMKPQSTRNIELGTKWDVLAKQLALTAALYRTENTNEISLLDTATNTYSQLGKRRVQGVELGMVGQFTRDWSVTAGVATMKATILEGTTGNNSTGAHTRWSPDLTATLWTSYKIDNAFTVGGGVRYTSEQKRLVDPSLSAAVQNVPGIPSYAVADALLSYKASKNVTVQLNVYNLFDKFYINTLNNSGARASFGVGRSAQLSASLAF
jgi:catecholate siderophore receptor